MCTFNNENKTRGRRKANLQNISAIIENRCLDEVGEPTYINDSDMLGFSTWLRCVEEYLVFCGSEVKSTKRKKKSWVKKSKNSYLSWGWEGACCCCVVLAVLLCCVWIRPCEALRNDPNISRVLPKIKAIDRRSQEGNATILSERAWAEGSPVFLFFFIFFGGKGGLQTAAYKSSFVYSFFLSTCLFLSFLLSHFLPYFFFFFHFSPHFLILFSYSHFSFLIILIFSVILFFFSLPYSLFPLFSLISSLSR